MKLHILRKYNKMLSKFRRIVQTKNILKTAFNLRTQETFQITNFCRNQVIQQKKSNVADNKVSKITTLLNLKSTMQFRKTKQIIGRVRH